MFIDDVLKYLKEADTTKIEIPDWATKALADKMAKDITGVQDNGDSIDITAKSNGRTVTYNINKSGNVTEK